MKFLRTTLLLPKVGPQRGPSSVAWEVRFPFDPSGVAPAVSRSNERGASCRHDPPCLPCRQYDPAGVAKGSGLVFQLIYDPAGVNTVSVVGHNRQASISYFCFFDTFYVQTVDLKAPKARFSP